MICRSPMESPMGLLNFRKDKIRRIAFGVSQSVDKSTDFG